MPSQPLCFVLMPFGSKPDPAGGPDIDFNRVYETAIKPGIEHADMLPIRADEEKLGGIIHKAMFERLLLCDFAVADLTTSNPNVMYELGVRHAARPRTTLTVYAESSPLPFDVRLLRTQPYRLGDRNQLAQPADLRLAVTTHLRELRAAAREDDVGDSPLFQLVSGWDPKPLPLDAAESFGAQTAANEEIKHRLDRIRAESRDPQRGPSLSAELAAIRAETLAAGQVHAGVLTELMLTHRSLKEWTGMIEVFAGMPESLRRQVPMLQQVAFAYNRRAEATGDAGDRARAVSILEELEQDQGPSSETSGLLGRIYKSQWLKARKTGSPMARQYLAKAVKAYVRGFETDWREVYPGVNAVTLLHVQGDERSSRLRDRLLPVVRFAVERRLEASRPDYWDHATMLEVAVLADDVRTAQEVLVDVVAADSEAWQPETTAGNLRLILEAHERLGRDVGWIQPILAELEAAAGETTSAGTTSEGPIGGCR